MMDVYLTIVTHPFLWIFVGLTTVFFLIQGLTAQKPEDWTSPFNHLDRIGRRIGFGSFSAILVLISSITWLVILLTLLFGLYKLILEMIWYSLPSDQDQLWSWRFTLAQVAALTAILGAVVALPVTISRIGLNRRQRETAEEGLRTDRINKAVEGLGADKIVKRISCDGYGNTVYYKDENGDEDKNRPVYEEVTEPNIEVRLGSILALSSIAENSEDDLGLVLKILSAYTVNNSNRLIDGSREEADYNFRKDVSKTRNDVLAALNVIRKIRKAKLNSVDLEDFIMLQKLSFASQTVLFEKLNNFNLQFSDFSETRFYDTVFSNSLMNLTNANGTRFHNCDLSGAILSGVEFNENTKFFDTTFRGAVFLSVDLSKTDISQSQIDESYGNRSVILPERLRRPKHWNNSFDAFRTARKRWHAYQKHIGYKPQKDE